MTEREKFLDEVVRFFINKADSWRKLGTKTPEASLKFVHAGQWDAAAVEMVYLGATEETVDWAISRYLRHIRNPFFDFNYLQLAISMAETGMASIAAVEKVINTITKYYCTCWAIQSLEKLTRLISRQPTRKEIFALAETERKNQISLDPSLHEELLLLAKRHLPASEVKEVEKKIKEKIDKWKTFID